MSKPEFKLLPCVFCTIGFNSYVAVNKLVTKVSKKIRQSNDKTTSDSEKALLTPKKLS